MLAHGHRTDCRRQLAAQGSDGVFVAVRLRYIGHSRAHHRLDHAAREYQQPVLGLPTKITAGIDYQNSSLDAKRSVALTDPPYHSYTSSSSRRRPIGSRPSASCRRPTSPAARDSNRPGSRRATVTTRRRRAHSSMRRRRRSIQPRPTTRCTSASSIASRRRLPCSAASRAAFAPRMSTSASA